MSKSKWLVLALVVSLALNAAFLVMRIHRGRSGRKPGPPPPASILAPFKMAEEQRQKIEPLLRKFRLDSIGLKQDIFTQRVEILEELGNPEFDAAKVREKTAALNQLEDKLNDGFIQMLLQIADILDSKQRVELIYQLSRHWYSLNSFAEKGGPHE